MTDLTLDAAAYSIQSAKSSLRYGQLAVVPVQASAAAMLVRASLAKIPSAATVTSATLQVTTAADVSGSVTLTCYEVGSSWTSSVTWATRPTYPTTLDTQTLSSPTAGTLVEFDVTAAVQRIVAGTDDNFGFQVSSGSTLVTLNGAPAQSGDPTLLISYELTPDEPSNLHPSSGYVSISKPTLSFDADDDITALQVQIDAPPGSSSPIWDSGTVPATAGLLDLSTTTYAGLADGMVRVWRARQKNGAGWSDWSAWVQVARSAKSVLTITSPASSSITDGTPPITWTFGGHQVAWRVKLIDAVTGRVIASSGKQIGNDTSWTPPTGLTRDGQSAVVAVNVWDDVDRSSTADDPIHVYQSMTVTLNLDDGVGPMDSVDVMQPPPQPVIRVSGIRNEGTPDEVALFRSIDGGPSVMVGRWDGTDVFRGNYVAVWDHTAPMNVPLSYRLAPITHVSGTAHIARGGNAESYTASCAGIWLVDETTTQQKVFIVGTPDGQHASADQSQPEQVITHTPISSDSPLEVVIRRLASYPAQGAISGALVDAMEWDAADSESALRTFKAYDPSHTYRLVLGRQNLRVRLTGIEITETPYDNPSDRVALVSFDWYATADQS